MAFDPDAYLASKAGSSKPAFDPDAYLAGKAPKAEPEKTLMQKADEAFLKIPGMSALAEFASSANQSVAGLVDFFGPDTVNALLELSGSDKRMPTASQAVDPQRNFMDEGLARDVVRGAGRVAPIAVGVGAGLRSIAGALPAQTQGESALVGTVRQLGNTTAGGDAAYGAMSGAGAEVGRSVGGDTGAFVGSIAAPLAGSALRMTPDIVKQIFTRGPSNAQAFKQAVADFAEIGSSPSVGQARGDTLAQGVENISSKLLGGGPIQRKLASITARMQSRISGIADDISPVRGEVEAGRVIQKGIKDGFVPRFQQQSGDLWRKFDSLINPSADVNATNTMQTLNRIVNTSKVGEVFNNSTVTKVKDALESTNGVIDYRTFRELRSAVGEKLGSTDLVSDIPRAQLKQLYGALSQDLRDIANNSGRDAVAALSRANKFTAAGHKRLDDFVERVATKVDLDKVFSATAKGGEGIQSINAIKRSLKPDEWEAVVSNVIRRMGRANSANQDEIGGQFSVPKFLTDWDKLGPAKKAMFSGSDKLNAYSQNLDRIARVARLYKEDVTAMANPSGTGQFGVNVATLSGAGASLATGNPGMFALIMGGVAANNAAARLMTSDKFVQWLAQTSVSRNIPAQLSKLPFIADKTGMNAEISDFVETLRTAGLQQKQAQPEQQTREARTQ